MRVELHRAVEHPEQRPAREHEPEDHIDRTGVVEGREVERDDEQVLARVRGVDTRGDRAAATVGVDGDPAQVESGERCGRRGAVDDEEAVALHVDGASEPFGDRVRDRPVAGASAQRGRGFGLAAVAARIEIPRAQLREHGRDQ